ncbi:hypothetical protein ACVR1G_05335 [Streptococcus dentasini]
METEKRNKKIWIGLGIIISLGILVFGIIGGKYYMDKKREEELYKRGFRLLEEQIAVYIKENYSGVKKVEFTDIKEYEDSYTFVKIIITDKYGDRQVIDNGVNGEYGTSEGLYALEYGVDGKPIIYLEDIDKDKEIDVSDYESLPDKAKLKTSESIDFNIEMFKKGGSIKGVTKDKKGSPEVQIVYNLKYGGILKYGND